VHISTDSGLESAFKYNVVLDIMGDKNVDGLELIRIVSFALRLSRVKASPERLAL
jgi:hypothetical protein